MWCVISEIKNNYPPSDHLRGEDHLIQFRGDSRLG
jgi:hypothetical protein